MKKLSSPAQPSSNSLSDILENRLLDQTYTRLVINLMDTSDNERRLHSRTQDIAQHSELSSHDTDEVDSSGSLSIQYQPSRGTGTPPRRVRHHRLNRIFTE